MAASRRIRLIDKVDLVLDLEYNKQFIIVHLPKFKITRESYQDFFNSVPAILEFVETFGFDRLHTAIPPEDKLTKKLLDRLGAVYLGSADGLDVYEYTGEK